MIDKVVQFDDPFDLDEVFDKEYTISIDRQRYFRTDHKFRSMLTSLLSIEVLNVMKMNRLMLYQCIRAYSADDPIDKVEDDDSSLLSNYSDWSYVSFAKKFVRQVWYPELRLVFVVVIVIFDRNEMWTWLV